MAENQKEIFRKVALKMLGQAHAETIKSIGDMMSEVGELEEKRGVLMGKIKETLASLLCTDPKFNNSLSSIVDAAIKMGEGAIKTEEKDPEKPAPAKRASRIKFERDAAGRITAAIPEE